MTLTNALLDHAAAWAIHTTVMELVGIADGRDEQVDEDPGTQAPRRALCGSDRDAQPDDPEGVRVAPA